MRYSKQRKLIYKVVQKSKMHPDANLVYEQAKKVIPNISLGTVYRNLNYLSKNGAIKSIVDGSKTRYDGNLDPHFHLKCDKCGFIKDVQARDINLRFQLNDKYDFKASNIEFTINGICNKHK